MTTMARTNSTILSLGPTPFVPLPTILDTGLVRVVDVPSIGGIVDGEDLLTSNPVGMPNWTSEVCAAFGKFFNETPLAEAYTFTLFDGVKCRTVGYDMSGTQEEVVSSFLASEGWMIQMMLAPLLEDHVTNEVAPLTGGTAEERFAALLQDARINYPGKVIFLMGARDAMALGKTSLVYTDGNGLFTAWGDPIVIGTDDLVDDGGDPGDLTMWWIAPFTLFRAPVQVHQSLDQAHNEVFTLIERSYALAVDGSLVTTLKNA